MLPTTWLASTFHTGETSTRYFFFLISVSSKSLNITSVLLKVAASTYQIANNPLQLSVWRCQASGFASLRVHTCIHDSVSPWITVSAKWQILWYWATETRASVQIISVLLAVEIYLGEGPTSLPSLGHDDAYKAITFCVIQPARWHGWLTAFRGSCQTAAIRLLQHVFLFCCNITPSSNSHGHSTWTLYGRQERP